MTQSKRSSFIVAGGREHFLSSRIGSKVGSLRFGRCLVAVSCFNGGRQELNSRQVC